MMLTMPAKKTSRDADSAEESRGPGRPKGRTPTYTIHTAIDMDTGLDMEEYMAAQPFEPKLKSVIEKALRMLMEADGFKSKRPRRTTAD